MELYQARYFVAVSRLLNFTRAAQHCHVTQPALTKAIQKLEAELGGELIHRERQFTQLTQLGKLVLPMLEQMIEAADDARARAHAFKSRELAPLKIGLPPCISATLIVGPLTRTAVAMPGLRVELIEASPSELPDLLMDGKINAAIAGDIEELPDRVNYWPLFEERFMVLTSASNTFAQLSAIPLGSLQEEVWLDRTGCETTRRFWTGDVAQRLKPKIHHRTRHEAHLQQMVAAGLGIALIPEHVPFEASVVACRIEGDPFRRNIQLLAAAGTNRTPGLETFIEAVREHDWIAQIQSGRSDNAGHQSPVDLTSAP
jgi:DNA-binding transcriptional LysR family regulator